MIGKHDMERQQTFICDNCGRELPFVDDDEAIDEMIDDFGYLPPQERAIVCDDCFDEIMRSNTGVDHKQN